MYALLENVVKVWIAVPITIPQAAHRSGIVAGLGPFPARTPTISHIDVYLVLRTVSRRCMT